MKKICVISGTRADYGLLFWLMKSIQADPVLELQVVVTCMHLKEKFGNTWKNFELDGFSISAKVDVGEIGNSKKSVVEQISQSGVRFYEAYEILSPDLVVILGDRYEMLAAAQTAFFSNIPIAHIHGGEITEGAFDDVIRHSITKMSSYHFTATELYRNRVIQMGEHPFRVFNVGAVGLEHVRMLNLLDKKALSKELKFPLKEQNILVTYHPVTANREDLIDELLNTLEKFSELGQIITMPNSDPGHESFFAKLNLYAKGRKNVHLSNSLGSLRYLSAMKVCDAVVGNSSSGIIEAPYIGTPTLNIGTRQRGRLRADSIVDCDETEIQDSLNKVLNFKPNKSCLHGDGNSSEKIVKTLKQEKLRVKTGFYDA